MLCPGPEGRVGTLLFQDSTTIPCVMQPVQGQVMGIVRILLLVTLPIAFLILWGKMRDQKPIFSDLIRIVAVFLLLIGYGTVFQEMTGFVGALANALYPSGRILAFYEAFWGSPLVPGTAGSFLSYLSDPMGLFYVLLVDFLKILVFLFTLVRYALLSFLYAIGPLLFAMGAIPGLFFMVLQWARNALEVMLWLVVHNLFIGIFTAINLVQAVQSGPLSEMIANRVLTTGVMLVLVLMFLLVPILTHLLLDRSYEGIGSFVGPQVAMAGKRIFEGGVLRPLSTGEMPFGLGEVKLGTVTKDTGQGKRVYRKKQLRIGPYSVTSLLWQRKAKEKKTTTKDDAPQESDVRSPTKKKTTGTRKTSSSAKSRSSPKSRSKRAPSKTVSEAGTPKAPRRKKTSKSSKEGNEPAP